MPAAAAAATVRSMANAQSAMEHDRSSPTMKRWRMHRRSVLCVLASA
jgi:hypothetical protein